MSTRLGRARILAAGLLALGCASGGPGGDSPGQGGAGGAVAGTTGSGGAAGRGGASGGTSAGGVTGNAGTGGASAGTAGTIGPGTGGTTGAGGSTGGVTGSAGSQGTGGTAGAGGIGATGGTTSTGGAGTGGSTAGRGGATGGAGGRGGSTGTGGTAGSVAGCRPAPTTYRNLFTEILGKSAAEVDAKVNGAFQQLFHGAASDQPIFYMLGTDQAYLLDVVHNDVRSEGISYGMMIAVQLDKKTEFDLLWQFAVKRMRQPSGFFAWQLNPQGGVISTGSAPDGEEYFATALMFASKRWGDGTGDFAYSTQARTLLDKMANNGMFNRTANLVLFGVNAAHTDASYVLPAFYEAWACFDSKNRSFWGTAATTGRAFFPKTTNGTTGLAPDQSELSGSPHAGASDFDADAWRVVMNVMMDHHFFGIDPWQVTWAAKFGAFWKSQGNYGEQYSLTGTVIDPDHQSGLVAMNAMLGFALPTADGMPFLQELWATPIPAGTQRYYNGSLYLLALLHISGQFHLWY